MNQDQSTWVLQISPDDSPANAKPYLLCLKSELPGRNTLYIARGQESYSRRRPLGFFALGLPCCGGSLDDHLRATASLTRSEADPERRPLQQSLVPALLLTVERLVERGLRCLSLFVRPQGLVRKGEHGGGGAKGDVWVPLVRFAAHTSRELERVERLHGRQLTFGRSKPDKDARHS